jgi:hypothetical protein
MSINSPIESGIRGPKTRTSIPAGLCAARGVESAGDPIAAVSRSVFFRCIACAPVQSVYRSERRPDYSVEIVRGKQPIIQNYLELIYD